MRTSTVVAIAASAILPCEALNLVKRDNPRVIPFQFHRRVEPKIFRSPALQRRAGTVSQTLDNFEDGSLYFANTTIGTPAQNFRFHIDTGSSDLWVNTDSSFCEQEDSSNGNSESDDEPCTISGLYSANSSSTYKYINSDFEIQYADGSQATGDYVSDNVGIGGITLKNQQFGVGYTSSSSEGVMGIGYTKLEALYQNADSLESATTYANVPQNMVDQGFIQSNAYSLWLDDINSATGNILFGGVDSDKYQGSLASLDIVQENGGYLEMLVTLDSITMSVSGQNTTALSSQTTVLLDSGSTLTYVPTDTADTIYNAVQATYSSRYGLAFCSCDLANSTDNLTFTFAGKSITVQMSEMVLEGGISQSLDCTFGIVPQSSSTSAAGSANTPFTLGDSFIRNAYIVYDLANNQISLAQTNNQATSSNILEIGTGSGSVPDVTGSAAAAATSLSGGSENVDATGAGAVSGSAKSTATTAMVTSSSSSALAVATKVPSAWMGALGAGAVAAMAIVL